MSRTISTEIIESQVSANRTRLTSKGYREIAGFATLSPGEFRIVPCRTESSPGQDKLGHRGERLFSLTVCEA
jgi:hypothetical protein